MKNKILSLRVWLSQTALGPYLLMAFSGVAAYLNAVRHPFVHDDIAFIVENPAIKNFDLWKTFVHPLDMGMFGVGINAYYRPFLDLANHGQYQFFGLDPHGFHAFNVAVHILNAWLVYRITRHLFRDTNVWGVSCVVAMIFLLHPVQTQAVACVSGISNLLFVFFGLSAMSLLLLSRRREGAVAAAAFAGSLVVFLMALLCKEQALIFPLLVVWWEICHPVSSGLRRAARVGGWTAVAVVYVIIKARLLGSQSLWDEHFFNPELFLRVGSIPQILLTNLRLILAPVDLHYFRSVDILAPKWPWMIALAALIAVIAVAARRADQTSRRMIIFGAGWFLIAQAMTINIIPLIWEYSSVSVAEHFLYLPILGILWPCAWMCRRWRVVQENAVTAAVFVLVLLTTLTVCQNRYWSSEIILFERAARYEPLARVQMLLGKARYKAGDFSGAIEAYQAALETVKRYERLATNDSSRTVYRLFLKDICHDMAVTHQTAGDLPSSEKFFLQALVWSPDDAVTHNDLGVLYTTMDKPDEALKHFQKAYEMEPGREIFARNYTLAMESTEKRLQKLLDQAREQLRNGY